MMSITKTTTTANGVNSDKEDDDNCLLCLRWRLSKEPSICLEPLYLAMGSVGWMVKTLLVRMGPSANM